MTELHLGAMRRRPELGRYERPEGEDCSDSGKDDDRPHCNAERGADTWFHVDSPNDDGWIVSRLPALRHSQAIVCG